MRVLCVFGRHNYGDPGRGDGYEYSNFLPALARLGHEVLFFEIWDRTSRQSFKELNAAFLAEVEQSKPDVVLSVLKLYEVWLETWEILRHSGAAATVNWATDDDWKYPQFSRFLAPAFHAFTTTYPAVHARYRRDGIDNVLLTQWGANAANLRPPKLARDCRYGVSFLGTAHSDRPAYVEALRRRGVEVTCFGHGWPSGPVSGEEIPRIIRDSVISLNLASSVTVRDGHRLGRMKQIKARTFEVPGAGGFLLTEWADGLERYYSPGREVAIFNGIDDLADKARYYLTHLDERDAIARAGYERTVGEHTYDSRLATVLDFALRRRDRCRQATSSAEDGGIDWIAFDRAVASHRLNAGLSLVRAVLAGACRAVWGPMRGPRAARRIAYELSWRLAGAHTYSAAGWPGRMFYEVS